MADDLDELERVAASEDAAWMVALIAELRASRTALAAAREFLDALESGQELFRYPLQRADHLAKLIDIAKAKREVV